MCHLSMKLSDKFDPNQMYTSDKIVVKHISVKETLLKLDPGVKVRTCDDACGARAPGGQDTPPLQRGRPNEPQDTALAPGRTVPCAGRRA